MALSFHIFNKHIRYLKITGHMWRSNVSFIYLYSYVMTIYFDVFGSLTRNNINRNLKSTYIVSMEKSKIRLGKSNLNKKSTKHTTLEQVVDMDRYSASLYNTRCCFLLFHDINDSKKHAPTSDLTTSIRTSLPIRTTKIIKTNRKTT